MHVTMEHALEAVEAARKEAVKLKTQMCIAVVDSGANLKAFVRMDDAWVGSIDIAIKKAKTAVFFGMPTGEIGKLSQPGKSLFGIEHSNEGLITFPGGLPIVDEEGVLVGAIGVSGSSVENDHKVAEAGLKVVGVSASCRRIPGAPEPARANKRKGGACPAFFISPSLGGSHLLDVIGHVADEAHAIGGVFARQDPHRLVRLRRLRIALGALAGWCRRSPACGSARR